MDTWAVALLGEGSVGKSALVTQLVMDSFIETYDPTIEESYRKQYPIDDHLCMLEIIDTAGQEDYATLRNLWVTNCQGFILVYSVTSRSSFQRVERYYQDMIRTKRGIPKFILVGNKVDKVDQREVSTDEGLMLARSYNCPFFETSAKTRYNVDAAFTGIVRSLRETQRENPSPLVKTVKEKKQKGVLGRICVIL